MCDHTIRYDLSIRTGRKVFCLVRLWTKRYQSVSSGSLQIAAGHELTGQMATPLLPPPPRSAGATPIPRTRDQPGQDLLSSSPTELDNPLFPVQAPQEKSNNSKQESPEADVSFGSFTSGKSIPVPGRRPVLDNRHQASQDPLDSSDLLGSMDDGEQQMTVPTAQQHGSLLGGSTGPARHHLSTVPHNIPISSLHSQGLHPTTGLSRTNSLGINSGSFSGGGDHLINEIDAFLKAEQTHHDSPPPAKPSSPKSTSRPPPLSSSPITSYFHKHGQSPPHRPPRRLSYVHSSAGPSSPPAVSPISSLRHHGNDPVHTHSHKPPNSSVHPYEGLDHLDNLDEFGQWHVGSPSKDRRYESYDWGTPAKEVDNKDAPTLFGQTVDLMRSLSTNDHTKVSGRRSSEQSPDRQKRHSPSQSMRKGSRESKSNMDSVKDGTLPGVYPDPRKSQEVRDTQDKRGVNRSTSNSSQPEDKSNPSPASQSHSLLSEGAKGVSGIVNALGHLAARSAAVKPKSKWRTVMGPSTFSPPTSASKDHWNEYVTSASASGLGSMPGTFPSEHAFDDGVHREDNRTPTSQPIEITHHTPFDLNPATQNNQTVYIPGTSVPIHPTGSYTPAAPTGAPGYKSAGYVGATSGNRPRNDWAGTKLVGRREGNLKVLDEKVADVVSFSMFQSTLSRHLWLTIVSLTAETESASPTKTIQQMDSTL